MLVMHGPGVFQACLQRSAMASKSNCDAWVAAANVHTVVANLRALNLFKRAFITVHGIKEYLRCMVGCGKGQHNVRQLLSLEPLRSVFILLQRHQR
eukprot:824393-Karenia_brevis.AAC.1